jgi:hypothetical protein
VPAGKRFILTYINAFTAGNKADCTLLAGEVGGQFSNSGMIALKPSGTGVNIAVEELFIPLETGTALTVDCTSQLTTFVKMGGYYVQVS